MANGNALNDPSAAAPFSLPFHRVLPAWEDRSGLRFPEGSGASSCGRGAPPPREGARRAGLAEAFAPKDRGKLPLLPYLVSGVDVKEQNYVSSAFSPPVDAPKGRVSGEPAEPPAATASAAGCGSDGGAGRGRAAANGGAAWQDG